MANEQQDTGTGRDATAAGTTGGEAARRTGATGADTQRAAGAREMTQNEIEASGTDGAGTGGVGIDAGGYGPIPESEATG